MSCCCCCCCYCCFSSFLLLLHDCCWYGTWRMFQLPHASVQYALQAISFTQLCASAWVFFILFYRFSMMLLLTVVFSLLPYLLYQFIVTWFVSFFHLMPICHSYAILSHSTSNLPFFCEIPAFMVLPRELQRCISIIKITIVSIFWLSLSGYCHSARVDTSSLEQRAYYIAIWE